MYARTLYIEQKHIDCCEPVSVCCLFFTFKVITYISFGRKSAF